jgi:hypothetical protein
MLDVLASAGEANRTLAQGLEAIRKQMSAEGTELERMRKALANAKSSSAM